MSNRDRRHIDPAALGPQDGKAVNASEDGRFWSNWKTAAAFALAMFGAGAYCNEKLARITSVEAAAALLDGRMAKIETRVGNLEIVTNGMDRKIFSIDSKMDVVMRRYGLDPPLVDLGK